MSERVTMPKTNNFFVTKIKIPSALYQIKVMNDLLLFLLKSKKMRKTVFAFILENRLIKKRQEVNNTVKNIMTQKIKAIKKETESGNTCRIIELDFYAKGA